MIARRRRPKRRPILPLDEVLRRYAVYHGSAPSTVEQKQISLGRFAEFLTLAEGRPTEPTTEHLRRRIVLEFLRWYGRKWEPATTASKRKDLVALWGFAYDERFVRRPPFRIKSPRVPEKVPEGWTLPELRSILAACDALPVPKCDRYRGCFRPGVPRGAYLRAFALCYLATGLRLSAMLGVRRADVRSDLTFTVRWRTQKTRTEEVKQLTPEAWAAIQSLGEHEYCLPYGQTKAQQRRVRSWWKRVLRSAGLDASRGTGAQQLRRTAASFKELQDPGSGRKFLGHKTPGLAEKRYFVPRILTPGVVAPPVINFS